MRLWLRWGWLPLTLLLVALSWGELREAFLKKQVSILAPMERPVYQPNLISSPSQLVHSSALIALPDGDKLMFWFGGSREGASDVAIWQSRLHAGSWSKPLPIIQRDNTAKDEWRYIKKVGNPLAVRLDNGDIQLFFVSVGLGGWAGSSLNTTRSRDGGQTWTPIRKIVTSPFLNISTLVRTHAVHLADGGFYLPVYHEFIHKFPELLRFDQDGHLLSKTRMSMRGQLLQPALVQLGDQLFSFLRDGRRQNVYVQQSQNAGESWGAASPLSMENRDSSLAVAHLPDGRLLAVYNDGKTMREQLALAVSRDGVHWQHKGWLEYHPGSGDEYSYPSIVVEDNMVDVSYTWHRLRIKHVRFNLAWLDE